MTDSLQSNGLQHARLPWPSPCPTPETYSNSYHSSRCCHPTTSSSVIPFSSFLQSFPASGSFWVSSSYQVAKVLEFQLQHQPLQWIFTDWFPLGLTGWISLQSKGLWSILQTTVQKHQFFSPQLQLPRPYMTLEKPQLWLDRPLLAK